MKTRYMHILNGCPAEYILRTQICYALRCSPLRLAKNMAQINRERKLSNKWRKSMGWSVDAMEYRVQQVAV